MENEIIKSPEEIKEEIVKSPEEIKKESLKKFSRVKAGDSDVVEVVEEVMKDEKVAQLEQRKIDNDAEIARRQADNVLVDEELARYK